MPKLGGRYKLFVHPPAVDHDGDGQKPEEVAGRELVQSFILVPSLLWRWTLGEAI